MSAFTERSPLELSYEISTPTGGVFKWGANEPAGSRLRNVSFSTKIGEGFSLLTGTLARKIDVDYPDLVLGSDIVATLADGRVVFEGRLSAMPREVGQTHSISVTFVGHMAHAKDKKFSEIFVDRALGEWGDLSLKRRSAILTAGYTPHPPASFSDPADGKAGHSTTWTGPWTTYKPTSEAWYDAGPGNTIGEVAFSWQRVTAALDHTNPAFGWYANLSTDDSVAVSADSTSNLRAAGPGSGTLTATTTTRRYAFLQLLYTNAPGGADNDLFSIDWYKLAVYGNHGLTTHTGDPSEPDGLYVSDIIRHIAQAYCPEFNTDGVEDYDYVVQHCAYRDRTYPYDAFLDLNKYALAHLAVWEGKTLTFRPYDLTEHQWTFDHNEQGTIFSPVGLTLEDVYNGIVVRYTDLLTGIENVITPDDYPELTDTSDENPWNQRGTDHWYEDLTITGGQLEADAVQIGRAVLAEKNRPKNAGTLTRTGYVKDRAGNEHPVAAVRAGDVIQIASLDEINRLVVETDVDDEGKTLRVAVDLPFSTLEALFDRQQNARTAKGL